MTYPVTYLVGTPRRYQEFLKEHGLAPGRYARHVETVTEVDQAALWDEVLFLTGWQELPGWRELYNWAIVRQNLIRLINEAQEEGEDQ